MSRAWLAAPHAARASRENVDDPARERALERTGPMVNDSQRVTCRGPSHRRNAATCHDAVTGGAEEQRPTPLATPRGWGGASFSAIQVSRGPGRHPQRAPRRTGRRRRSTACRSRSSRAKITRSWGGRRREDHADEAPRRGGEARRGDDPARQRALRAARRPHGRRRPGWRWCTRSARSARTSAWPNVALGVEPSFAGLRLAARAACRRARSAARVTGSEGGHLGRRGGRRSGSRRSAARRDRAGARPHRTPRGGARVPRAHPRRADEQPLLGGRRAPLRAHAGAQGARAFDRLRVALPRGARAIADRFTVLKDGAGVGSGEMASVTAGELVHRMVGRKVEELFVRTPRARGEALLTLDGVSGVTKPTGVSLTLHRGEILGLAGLVGAGRTELLRAVFGLEPVASSAVRVRAFVGPASPSARLAQGVGLLGEDRKGKASPERLSIADNLTLSKLPRTWSREREPPAAQGAITRRFIDQLKVRCPRSRSRGRMISPGATSRRSPSRASSTTTSTCCSSTSRRAGSTWEARGAALRLDRRARRARQGRCSSSRVTCPESSSGRAIESRSCGAGGSTRARPVQAWDEPTLLSRVTGAEAG